MADAAVEEAGLPVIPLVADPGGPPARSAGFLPKSGPQRTFAFVTLVNTTGNGMVMISVVLYFTRVVHMSAARVGVGMTIAGLLGIAAGIPIGHLADRRGPREVQIVLLCLTGLTTVGYLLIRGFAVFIVVVALDMLVNNASSAVRGGLIRRIGGESAAAFRSSSARSRTRASHSARCWPPSRSRWTPGSPTSC